MVHTTKLDDPLTPASIYDSIAGSEEITTPIPAVFNGLEAWLTTNVKPGQAPAFISIGADGTGNYEGRLRDQSTRYRYTRSNGQVANFVGIRSTDDHRVPVLTNAADGIGGIPALYVDRRATGLRLPAERSEIQDVEAAVRPFLTDDYTFALVFSAPADAVGGIVSTGHTAGAADGSSFPIGWRVGFPDVNDGTLIYQHGPRGLQRITVNRTLGDFQRTLFIGRGRKMPSGLHQGVFTVVNQGVRSDHPFSFAYGRVDGAITDLEEPAPHVGAQGPGDGNRPQYRRKITHYVPFSRYFSDDEVTGLFTALSRPEHGGAF